MLKLWTVLLFIMISFFGISQERDSIQQNKYCFTESQIKEFYKATKELEESKSLILDLNSLLDTAQFKITNLDLKILEREEIIKNQNKKIHSLKLTRNISLGVGITALVFVLLK